MAGKEPAVSRRWFDFSLGQGYTVGRGGNHDGRDIQTPLHTPLTNLFGGTVTRAAFLPWGGEVDIKTPQGITETWAHLDAIGVHAGQSVAPGQFIGLSGGEGLPSQYSTGPHTHFSLFGGKPWDNLHSIDPTSVLEAAREGFIGGGPSEGVGTMLDSATPGATSTAQNVAQAAGVNITMPSSLDTLLKGLPSVNGVGDLLFRGGLVIGGAILILMGFQLIFMPNRKQAAEIVGAAVKA